MAHFRVVQFIDIERKAEGQRERERLSRRGLLGSLKHKPKPGDVDPINGAAHELECGHKHQTLRTATRCAQQHAYGTIEDLGQPSARVEEVDDNGRVTLVEVHAPTGTRAAWIYDRPAKFDDTPERLILVPSLTPKQGSK